MPVVIHMLLGSIWLCAGLAEAQELPRSCQGPDLAYVEVLAKGTFSTAPDQATLLVAVVTEGQKAKVAAEENARKTTTVQQAIRTELGAEGRLETRGYFVRPRYDHPPESAPVLAGYTVRNTVEVTTPNLQTVGRLIDAALASGANDVPQLEFSLRDPAPAKAQALQNAARLARRNAEALAQSLGVKLGTLLWVRESPPQSGYPVPVRSMARAADAATPVEPGVLDFEASVTLRAEIQGRAVDRTRSTRAPHSAPAAGVVGPTRSVPGCQSAWAMHRGRR